MSSWATRSPGADANALYVESGGNPFYLEQLARSPDREPRGAAAHDESSLAAIGVPSIVAAALAEELALLSAVRTSRAGRSGGGGRPLRARAGRGRGRDARGGR